METTLLLVFFLSSVQIQFSFPFEPTQTLLGFFHGLLKIPNKKKQSYFVFSESFFRRDNMYQLVLDVILVTFIFYVLGKKPAKPEKPLTEKVISSFLLFTNLVVLIEHVFDFFGDIFLIIVLFFLQKNSFQKKKNAHNRKK